MSQDPANNFPRDILETLRRLADSDDQSGHWSSDQLSLLAQHNIFKASVGRQWGGDGKSALDQHLLYESLARASLAVSLLLSQRDAAVGLIESSDSPLRHELLPNLARGETFATVGIAQLTTSRQGGPPVLRATPLSNGTYRLDGLIPWCTGAPHADHLVVGAATPNAHQNVLLVLPTNTPRVHIDPPMPLVALSSTATTSIHCDAAVVEPRFILRTGAQILTRPNHLPLGQAFLALGLCQSAIDLIAKFNSPSADRARDLFTDQLTALRNEVLLLSQPGSERQATAAAPSIRARTSDLALRTTHSAVTLYKGTALLKSHPAQRLAREALFLLVWSCPSPVIDCTLDLLTQPPPACDPSASTSNS
jgi:alkylation response protein AidB-like acyl-CoA dehydrogenase